MRNANGGKKKIAILATDGVERVELVEPRRALDEAGFETTLVSPSPGTLQTWNHTDKADRVPVDVALDHAKADEFDGLVLPGGVQNPDRLRTIPQAVEFVRSFVRAHKPIAAICHGPWMLAEADGVRGMHMTSWPSLQNGPSQCRCILVRRDRRRRSLARDESKAGRLTAVPREVGRIVRAGAATSGRSSGAMMPPIDPPTGPPGPVPGGPSVPDAPQPNSPIPPDEPQAGS